MTEYVHVGRHADVLASGRHIGPGERVTDRDLNLKPPDTDRHLLDEGVLVDVQSFSTGDDNRQSKQDLQSRAADLGIEGRSKMSADELRQAVQDHETGGEHVAA